MIFTGDYTSIYFIGFAIATLLALFFSEVIDSLVLRFISGVLLAAMGIAVFDLSAVMGAVLIGVSLLLIVRSFLWK